MIRSFRDAQTERLFHRFPVKKVAPSLRRTALRKLVLLDSAEALDDLRVPPGNRLEKRIGDRAVDIGEQTAYLLTAEFREFTDASHPVS